MAINLFDMGMNGANNVLNPQSNTVFNSGINKTGSSWGNLFNTAGSALQGISGVMQGVAGLGNFYNAYQANKLAKEQFAFEKASYATNLANTGKMINTAYNSAANISAQLGATTPGDSLASSQAITEYKDNAKKNHVATTIS